MTVRPDHLRAAITRIRDEGWTVVPRLVGNRDCFAVRPRGARAHGPEERIMSPTELVMFAAPTLPVDLPDFTPDDWPDAPPPRDAMTPGDRLFLAAMVLLGLCVAAFAVIGFAAVTRDTFDLVRSLLL